MISYKPLMFVSLGLSVKNKPVGNPIKKRSLQTLRQNGYSNCRATPFELLATDLITQHDEQPDQEFSGRGNFGDCFGAAARNPLVKRFELAVVANRNMHCLSEKVSEKRTPGFADRTEAHLAGARSFQRVESGKCRHLLDRLKA